MSAPTLRLVSNGVGEASPPADPHAETLLRVDAFLALTAGRHLGRKVIQELLNLAFAPYEFTIVGDVDLATVYVSRDGELIVFRHVQQ